MTAPLLWVEYIRKFNQFVIKLFGDVILRLQSKLFCPWETLLAGSLSIWYCEYLAKDESQRLEAFSDEQEEPKDADLVAKYFLSNNFALFVLECSASSSLFSFPLDLWHQLLSHGLVGAVACSASLWDLCRLNAMHIHQKKRKCSQFMG